MATLEQRLNDPEYRNWVKTVLCLQYVRDGLVDFAGVKSRDLHRKVLYQLQHYGNPSAKRLCPNISFNFRKRSITCCANCNGILAEILKYRNGNQSLNLTNTDPSKLLTEHWQVAKVFMNTGQDVTNTDPNETDISGLLNFIEKCSEPAQYITVPSNVEQVRRFRNQIIHTSDMKITDAEFKKNIPVMLALLEDPGYLLNDSRAIAAATGIKEVTNTDFKITTVNEIVVLKDFVHEQTELLRSEADKLRGEVSDCSSQMNEDLKTQQEKLNDFEGKMEKVQNALEILKTAINANKDHQDSLLQYVSSIEENVKSTKEGIDSLYEDINSRVTELEKRQEGIKQQINTLKRNSKRLNEQDTIKKRKINELQKGQKETSQHLQETMGEIQSIKSSQEKYQQKTDTEIQRLKQEDPDQRFCPTEEDKTRLVKYLKEGYKEILKVPVSAGFQHLPVSEMFAPVILVKEDKEENKPRNDTSEPDWKWTHKPKKESDSGKELQSYKEILQDVEEHRPIFLLGEAGTGKSTFCKHLTDLWCNESTTFQFLDPEVLTRYRFVFQVSCRFAEENDSVFDMICKQLFDDVYMKRIAEYLLIHNPEECFIILDGLDEWKGSPFQSTGRRGDIQGLPGRKGVEESLILITSRPWRFQALSTVLEKKNIIFELSGLKSPEMLTTVILKKMGDTDPEESCQNFLSDVERCSMLEMIKIPLIFQIVLNIWHENKTLHRSICQNYMSLINSFIERADRPQNWTGDERRLMEPLVYNIDYWKRKWSKAFDSLPECCQKFESFEQFAGLIISLSQLAFDFLFDESDSVIQQKLVFSRDDCKRYLSKEELGICLGIGIISKSQSHRGMWQVENYSFIHKTVQEFLAALCIAESNGVNSESIREHLLISVFESEILITFLCGLAPQAGADLLCDLEKDCYLDCYKYQRLVLHCWAESQHCNDTTYTCFTLSKLTIHDELDKDDIRLLISCLEASSTLTNKLEEIVFDLQEEQEERLFGCLFSLSLPMIRKVEIRSYSRGTLNHFYQSVSSYVTLENLNLCRFYSDNSSQDTLAEMDLRNHYKLEILQLTNLSLSTILLPLETNTGLRELTINDIEFDEFDYDEDQIICLSFSQNGMNQFYHSLSGCVNLVYLYLDTTCSDDTCKGDCSVLDLQNLHKLERLQLNNLSAKTVLFPQKTESCLRELKININQYKEALPCHLYLSCSGMDRFYQSLSGCISLERIFLNNISCCDDYPKEYSTALDLQKFKKLEVLEIKNLSVKTVLFPQETDSCLRNLKINACRYSYQCVLLSECECHDEHLFLSRGGMNQFYQSLSGCISLEKIVLHNISCRDDNTNEYSTALDLQKLRKLQELEIRNLSVITVLFLQETESQLRNLCINADPYSVERLFSCLSGYSEERLYPRRNGIDQFYQQPSGCNSLKTTCRIIDLQKLHKLRELKLSCLLVKAVLFSPETESYLNSITIHELKLVHDGFVGLPGLSQHQSCFSLSQLYESISRCVNLGCLVLNTISCSDKSCSVSVLDLQNLHRLYKLELRCLLVEAVLFPQETESSGCKLKIHELKLVHGRLEGLSVFSENQSCFSISQLYESISRCVNLEWLELNTISCNDQSCGSVSILDLQKLKLQNLELRCLLVESVLFPQETVSWLFYLSIHELKLVHGRLEGLSVFSENQSCFSISQLYESISRCVHLICLELNTISCSDKNCCSVSILDLQDLHNLQKIKLINLSLTTVLFPQEPNFHPICLKLHQLQLTHGSIEKLHRAKRSCISTPSVENIVCADHDTGCKLLQDDAPGDDNDASGDDNGASGDDNDASGDDNDASGDDNFASGDDNDASGDDSDVSGVDNH